MTFLWFSFLRYDGIYWDVKCYATIVLFVLMGAPQTYRPRNTFVRLVVGIHLVGGVLWGINMVSLFIHVYSSTIGAVHPQTVGEAHQFGYRLIGNSVGDEMITDTEWRQLAEINDLLEDTDDWLTRLRSNKKLAVATSRTHALNNRGISASQIVCLPSANNIYGYPIGIVVNRHFRYVPEAELIVRDLVEFGLIDKWTGDSHFRDFNVETAAPFSHYFLTADSVQLLLIQFMAATTSSILLFISECLVYWHIHRMIRLRRRANWLLNYLHLMLDHKRYVHLGAPPFFQN